MNEFFAYLFCTCLLATLATCTLTSFLRSSYNAPQFLLNGVAYLLLRLLWRTTAPSELPLKPGQGAVIIANHRSSVDPFFVHLAAHRRVRWMVAREYCEHPLFGWFLRQTGAIPTRRGGMDNAAIREAVCLLQAGHWVGLLPEGRINLTDQFMLPVRPGAALLARMAEVPILPIHIEGAPFYELPHEPLFMPAKVTITVGEPLYPSAEQTDEVTILAAVRRIAELAGRADFSPTLAGRSWRPTAQDIRDTHRQARLLRRQKRSLGK